MSETKQLALVVESTSALGPYWPTIVSDYLQKIISSFCGDEDMILDSPTVELGLVNFNMFPSVNGIQNHQRHCILVAASNPHPLPTSVNMPPIDGGMTSESHNFYAESVAKYFKLCGVSLSVISPKQLRKLTAIYNAAKRNPLETDTPINIVKDKKYLVLISEDFMDAGAEHEHKI